MKQAEFLSELASFLQPSLKQEDLNDILNDYKLHFQNGLLEGKSEMEIAADLGTPEDIARDILGEEQRFTEEPNYYTPRIEKPKRSKTAKVLFIILFVFLDITIIIPFLIAIWGAAVSLWAVTASFLAAPLLLGVALMFGSAFTLNQTFVAIGLTGIGLMIIPVSITFCRIVVKWTVLAFTWQSYTVKGGHKYE